MATPAVARLDQETTSHHRIPVIDRQLKAGTGDTFELDGIPGFNQDEEQHPPAKVVECKRRMREADAEGAFATGL